MHFQSHYDEELEMVVVDPPCDECRYLEVEDIWYSYMCGRHSKKCPYEKAKEDKRKAETGEAVENLRKFLEYHFRTTPITKDSINHIVKEAEEKLIRENQCIHFEEAKPPRSIYRKRVRWDERNRRRKKKGLPEKTNPYWSIFYYNLVFTRYDPVKLTFTFTEETK